MNANALARDILAAKPFTPDQAQATVEQAKTLQAARKDLRASLLRGRRLGLMCASDLSEDARLFRRAAGELGAQVSHIPAILNGDSSFRLIDATAQLLGQLYDAVECQDMDTALVRRLGVAASIPIYPGLACSGHPSEALAHELKGDAALDEKRAWVIQALLLRSID